MTSLKNRVENALKLNPRIVISKVEFSNPDFKHSGFSTEELESYGLTPSDLKKLERKGLAVRTYTKNMWLSGDKLPNGKEVNQGERFVGRGSLVRWLLLVPESL